MLYPCSQVPYSVLFTFSLHVNAEEEKNRAWVASPGPPHRASFSSCFTPKMTSGSVTSSHPTAALAPSLPFRGSGFGLSFEYWRFSSIRDLCLGCPGMEALQDGAPWGAGRFQISVLLLWALPWDNRAAWAKAFDRILWIGTVLGVPALWSSVLQVLGASMRRAGRGCPPWPGLASQPHCTEGGNCALLVSPRSTHQSIVTLLE